MADSKNARDRRQYKRRQLEARIRFLTSDDREAIGRLIDISEGGLFMATDISASPGDEIIAYPEGLGRLKGFVVRKDEQGVAIQFDIPESQRASLAKKISSAEAGLPYFRLVDRRAHERRQLSIAAAAVNCDTKESFECKVIDISESGAGVAAATRPAIGAKVEIGALKGTVTRHTVEGFAIAFGNEGAQIEEVEHAAAKA